MSDDLAGLGTVLVTGGAGFIGSHVVDRLRAGGASPVVLDDFSGGDFANVAADVPIVRVDVADPASIARIAEVAPNAIVHAAAQVSVPRSMAEPERDRAINLVGTANVIEGAGRAGDCRVVFLSTGGAIYGDTIEPATEETLPRPKAFYSIHKYAAERYLELSGLPYAIARLANVYGPRQRTDLEGGVVAIFAERLASGSPITIFGTGEQRRDFVHVADIARANVLAATADVSDEALNIAGGTETSLRQLAHMLLDVMGADLPIEYGPPRRVNGVARRLADTTRARGRLGFRAEVRLEDGLRSLVEWWRAEHEEVGAWT